MRGAKNMPVAIFDLNRTLYDPDTQSLLPGVKQVLQELSADNIEMLVISRKEPGREDILSHYSIARYFSKVFFVENKTREMFAELVSSVPDPVYVIGDYLHEEIRFGNMAGAKTIWLKRGKFSNLLPESDDDVPWRMISEFSEVSLLLLNSNP